MKIVFLAFWWKIFKKWNKKKQFIEFDPTFMNKLGGFLGLKKLQLKAAAETVILKEKKHL